MKQFNRLYIKLALGLALVFVAIGTSLLMLAANSMQAYYQEITQRLNASVAGYVTDELELISNGRANVDAVKQLAHHAMIINPALEVYLLDPQGQVISHALGDNQVQQQWVDLSPLRAFLSGTPTMPLLGPDPRNPDHDKVFSAAEVLSNGQLQGYVYIVLEGQKREQLATSIVNSRVFKISAAILLACLLFGLVSSLLIFSRLSRRLQALTAKADRIYQDGVVATKEQQGDEIERLGNAFDAMQDRIEQQVEQIRQADEMRRQLITNISHDLRTPLTSMQGYIETALLKQDQLSAEQLKHYLVITRNHSQRLARLVADLFELAKLDSNAVQPQLETFSIAELIQDIVQCFQLRADQQQIQLQLNGDLDTAMVRADIRLMERVFNNLLDNALRHTPRGGAVRITLNKSLQGVQVVICDSGEGIANQDLPHIFDRFFHVRDSDQEALQSTGLGLAIVKRILDLHRSTITVQSKLKQGTSFCFELPSSNQLPA